MDKTSSAPSGHLLGGQLTARFKPKVVFFPDAVLCFAGTALLPSSAVGLRITSGACFGLACGCFCTPVHLYCHRLVPR